MVKTSVCRDCGRSFTLTKGEQEWYREKGFVLPKRCPVCRRSKVYDERYDGWRDTMYQEKPHPRVNHFAYHKF